MCKLGFKYGGAFTSWLISYPGLFCQSRLGPSWQLLVSRSGASKARLKLIGTLFLKTIALNLSKSLRLALLVLLAIDFAMLLAAQVFSNPSFWMIFRTTPVLAPLETGTLNLVSLSLLMGMTCLAILGPSTRALFSLTISTMTARFPSCSP